MRDETEVYVTKVQVLMMLGVISHGPGASRDGLVSLPRTLIFIG